MGIILEKSPINSNPFRVFTRALYSIYRQKFIEIGGGHLGRFPRQTYLNSGSEIGSLSNWTVFDQANFILMTIVELFCVILSIL